MSDNGRLEEYITMLKNGDVAGCLQLRLKHMDDREFNRKLITVEEVHYKWVRLYIQEIQLLRAENTGLRNLVDGTVLGDKAKERRGLEQLARVKELRADRDHVDIPNPKDY